MMVKLFKFKKKKRKVKTSGSDLQPSTAADYYETWLLEQPNYLPFPTDFLTVRKKVQTLCKKRLSTSMVGFLNNLYDKTDDGLLRSLLAKKIVALQRDYLESFKEYSDRAMLLLSEREKVFDKWEGIYILGCFGGQEALPHLREKLENEENALLRQTIQRAINKIEAKIKRKIQERGF